MEQNNFFIQKLTFSTIDKDFFSAALNIFFMNRKNITAVPIPA